MSGTIEARQKKTVTTVSGTAVKTEIAGIYEVESLNGTAVTTAKAISGILEVKINWDTIKSEDEEGREVYDMCKAFDDYKEEGRREGELEMALKLVKNLMKSQKVSFEDAVKMLGISKSRQKKLSALM